MGIYVTELQESSVCKDAGLQIGDRLLKVRNLLLLLLFSFLVKFSYPFCACSDSGWSWGVYIILHLNSVRFFWG